VIFLFSACGGDDAPSKPDPKRAGEQAHSALITPERRWQWLDNRE
jgi:hypothetical protein